MLLSFRSDRLFEEAARSTDGCDKLLKRLQRLRRLIWVSSFGFSIIALGFCIWAFIPLNRWLNSPESPAPSLTSASAIIALAIPFFFAMGSLWAGFLHTDACVKFLLIIRGQQAHRDAAGKE